MNSTGKNNVCKKTSVLIFLFFLLITTIFAGPHFMTCEISGTVKDSITGEGLPFATVQLKSQNESDLMYGVIADEDGQYVITGIIPGKYSLIASFMGYDEQVLVIDIQTKKEKHDILLSQKSYSLSEVTVTAEKNIIERNIEKTIINVAKNTTLTGGTAIDVMQSLPSMDVDIDGNIKYRGSDKVMILLNGKQSELVRSINQIPAGQIERIEIINNPSAKYDAEGMSGIINIVLKSGSKGKNKTTLMLKGGYPLTLGGNAGFSVTSGKVNLFLNGGLNYNTKYQIKEHFRDNYEDPDALNYYQYDRQDVNMTNAIINSDFEYVINKNQQIGISVIGSKNFNNAFRKISYETENKTAQSVSESVKEIDIDLNNLTIDGNLNYQYNFRTSGRVLKSNFHYSFFSQLQQMNNVFFPGMIEDYPQLQNTCSEQLNKEMDFSMDYSHAINDSIRMEAGYKYSNKDLLNDFFSESYNRSITEWNDDTALINKFNYSQLINALYFNINTRLGLLEIESGIRAEYTKNSQGNQNEESYLNLFPAVNISGHITNHLTLFASYNRRINRPTISMLTPFTDEYADVLNMNQGNPELKPEYVNSYEAGSRFVFKPVSGFFSAYYRNIDKAISRIKFATNDSAFVGSFKNLDKAKLFGSEVSLSCKPFQWWSINASANIFYTYLTGEYGYNDVNTSKTGWNINISNQLRFPWNTGFQLSGYYRSKLPSAMGIYKERYYMDLAVNKRIFKDKGEFVFKVSDVFNSYTFGHAIDAVDENDYRFSQSNYRKIESRYFILSFYYNIDGKKQQSQGKKAVFFLDDFDK